MELLQEQIKEYTYKITYIVNDTEEVYVDSCDEYKEVFPIINTFIKEKLKAALGNYRVTHFDNYVRLINGDFTFRLYNIKD